MRLGLIVIFFSALLFANVNDKLIRNQNALEQNKEKEQQINQKLTQLGDQINIQKNTLATLQKESKTIEANLQANKNTLSSTITKLDSLRGEQKKFIAKRRELEVQMLDLLLKDISFVLILKDLQSQSPQDLITEESYHALSQQSKSNINSLAAAQNDITQKIVALENQMQQMQRFINEQNSKKNQLAQLQSLQERELNTLVAQTQRYDNELKQILKERAGIQQILEELKIVTPAQKKQSKGTNKNNDDEDELVLLEESSAKNPSQRGDKIASLDVRQVASSFHNISTTSYKGAKTIAPLADFTIEKRFGPYYDPVYKLKVFNESVTLARKGEDDKVKSVLDGKIVFAKDTAMLKKVVIVEHKNNLHTIYAQLDKIAPTIKPGSTIKKGYTIGRVENLLKFEVTLKDKHINPLELISVK